LAVVALPIPSTTFTAGAALVVLVVSAAWDLTGSRVRSLERQVDENWLSRYRGWVYGVGYGFQLGVGFVTFVKSALIYGFAAAAVTYGSPGLALLAGVTFGLTRGLSILTTVRLNSPSDLRSFFDRLTQSSKFVARLGATGVLVASALSLIAIA
jgi:hypothetical protein